LTPSHHGNKEKTGDSAPLAVRTPQAPTGNHEEDQGEISFPQCASDPGRSFFHRYGLVMNADKTKTMVFANKQISSKICINGIELENVEKFFYL